jgi:WD40 repeat protein
MRNAILIALILLPVSARPASAQRVAAAVDVHGDPLPPGAVARLGTERLNLGGDVYALAFAPDGKRLAGCGSYRVAVWEVPSGKLVWGGNTPEVRGLGFIQGGAAVAAGERHVFTRDTATGKDLGEFELPGASDVRTVAVSRDGKRLGVAGDDRVRLWDLDARRELHSFAARGQGNFRPAFSADCALVAVADADKRIRVLETATGRERGRFPGDEGYTHHAAFSPDGKLLAYGGSRPRVEVWDLDTGRQLREFSGYCQALAFAPDGKALAIANADNTARLYDLTTGKPRLEVARQYGRIAALAFSPDGRLLATAGSSGMVQLWDTATGAEVSPRPRFEGDVVPLGFGARGRELLLTSANVLHRWDVARPAAPREMGRLVGVCGGLVAAPRGPLVAGVSGDAVWLYDAALGCEVARVDTRTRLGAVTFTPDGRTAVAAGGGEIVFVDAGTCRVVRRVAGPKGDFTAVAVGLDGQTVAAVGGGSDRTLYLHRLGWGGAPKTAPSPITTYYSTTRMVLSPTGRALIIGGPDRVVVWDVSAARVVRRIPGWGFALSPDGRLLAVAGDGVGLYEVATGELVALRGGGAAVGGVAFSSDGRLLAGGGRATAVLWDVTPAGLFPEEAAKGPPHAQELARCWAALAGADAVAARKAMARLAAHPDPAVPYLGERLKAVPAVPAAQVERWLDDLDARNFAAREEATRKLRELGTAAGPYLRRRLEGPPPLEVARRLEQLLRSVGDPELSATPGDALRALRAIQVLGGAGTPAAREVLRRLAAGMPDALETQDARGALRRLEERD